MIDFFPSVVMGEVTNKSKILFWLIILSYTDVCLQSSSEYEKVKKETIKNGTAFTVMTKWIKTTGVL
jgi:hypothetical protein